MEVLGFAARRGDAAVSLLTERALAMLVPLVVRVLSLVLGVVDLALAPLLDVLALTDVDRAASAAGKPATDLAAVSLTPPTLTEVDTVELVLFLGTFGVAPAGRIEETEAAEAVDAKDKVL